MLKQTIDMLRDFCLTPAPAGFENEIARKLYHYLALHCASIEMDNVGNVIGRIAGKNSELRPVLINAHMDRIGFIVTMITDDGYLKLGAIGTPNEKVLPGLTLAVRKKDRSGWVSVVVGTKCTHLMSPEEMQKAPSLNDLMIDVGVDTAEDVRALGIDVGSPVVYTPTFTQLTESRVCGTAMDNCGCVTALVNIAELLSKQQPERDVYIVGNVWEEYNQRATTFLARKYEPVVMISMDMLLAGDTPDVRGHFHGAMGKGPMASCYNYCIPALNGCIAHDGLYELAEKTAAGLGTGIQRYACVGGFGDNAYAQFEADGPAVIEIGSAVRYAHSSCEVADAGDIVNLSKLVAGMACGIGVDFCQARFTL